MRIVETPVFTSAVTSLLSDEEYRQLQLALLILPEQGALIRGSRELRKLRWGDRGHGKRGGVRVICYWHAGEQFLALLLVGAPSGPTAR